MTNHRPCFFKRNLPALRCQDTDKNFLPMRNVRRMMSDMKVLSMRDLNRKTASVLDALERGETFELRRNGRAVGYLTQTPQHPERKPDWDAHFEWLRKQRSKGGGFAAELEEDRRRQRAREAALDDLA